MIASRSGHASGVFLPNWSPLVPSALTKHSSGLLYLMGNLIDSKSGVCRIFISTGQALDSRERIASKFDGEKVRDVYLPEWFLIDVTISGNSDENKSSVPRTLTFVSVAEKKGELDVVTKSKIFIGKSDSAQSNWKDFALIAGRFRMDELWHRITGVVKPSWGMYNPADGTFFVADCNTHLGVISDDPLPVGFDMSDIGRIENFIRECGVDVENIERPFEDVAKTLSVLEGGSATWTKAVTKIMEEEKKRNSNVFFDN